jgi:tetratricopeptide (TPR) repeat protein
MTMPDSFWGSAGDSRDEPAGRSPQDRAYFLDLLGDSHHGLGRPEAAIEAYTEAADGFESQGARCSYALCLFKIAVSYLALGEPWHALGYLEACLSLLEELGMTRHEALARRRLEACQAALTGVKLDQGARGLGPPKQSRCTHAATVDSCYARDRRRAALAQRR